ncbi:MAG: hypothetical protein HZC41_08050 [Chloroflexi bacterium]|nr:hypothetical protein [Chloroflexota bacterium]
MKILTQDALVVCEHELGVVKNNPTQSLVTIERRKVLVEIDPEGRQIGGCPNYGITIKPCLTTLKVQVGYSDLIRIEGRRVCLDTVTGFTDGTPPGLIHYKVNNAGQHFVSEGG